MKRKFAHKKVLIFSRWSRKNYATFASLGKVVNIARVSVSVCNQALRKTSVLTGLFNTITIAIKNTIGDFEKLRQSLGIPDLLTLFNLLFLKNIVSTSSLKSNESVLSLHIAAENPCFISNKAWIFCFHSNKSKKGLCK